MIPYLHVGKLTFESYTLFTNLGTLLGLFGALAVLECYCANEKSRWKPMVVIILLMLISNPAARALRNAFSGEVLGEATHFLGRVFVLAIVYPWMMEKCFQNRNSKNQVMNAAATFFVIQHFFNRIACWLNGCCGGVISLNTKYGFPRQLLEAAGMLLLGVVVLAGIRKVKNTFSFCCIGYGIVVFLSEFAAEEVERICWLTSVQYGAVVLMMIALYQMRKEEHRSKL